MRLAGRAQGGLAAIDDQLAAGEYPKAVSSADAALSRETQPRIRVALARRLDLGEAGAKALSGAAQERPRGAGAPAKRCRHFLAICSLRSHEERPPFRLGEPR